MENISIQLNFNVNNYTNGELNVTWELSYTMSVMYTSDNVEAVVSKAVEELPINNNDIETIKEAIVKIRVGQSQFTLRSFNQSSRAVVCDFRI